MNRFLVIVLAGALAACGGGARAQLRTAANDGPGQCRGDGDCGAGLRCLDARCVVAELRPEAPVASTPVAMSAPTAQGCTEQSVYYDFDRASLNPGAVATADSDAACIQRAHHGEHVTLVGHGDPRGTTEYNLALGQARAASMARQLERNGVPASAIVTQSVGAEYATGHDEATWARDRVVTFEHP